MKASVVAAAIGLLVSACHQEGPSDKQGGRATGSQQSAQLTPNDPGYVAEDPGLARWIGKAGPAARLQTLDGGTLDLAREYGKRPVYLKVWATYCIPCRAQMPKFEQIYERYHDQMAVIAVDVGLNEDPAKVRAFVASAGLKMPVAIDDGSLGAWLKMDGTPFHLVIGRDGRILFAGHQDGAALDAALTKAIAEPNPVSIAVGQAVDQLAQIKVGDIVPPLHLMDGDGKPQTMQLGHSSRPKALLFTSTWCESYLQTLEPVRAQACHAMRDAVHKIAEDHKFDWHVVATHLWTEPKDLEAFQKQLGPDLPVMLDTDGRAFKIFGVTQLPTAALIDRTGRLKAFATDLSSLTHAIKSSDL